MWGVSLDKNLKTDTIQYRGGQIMPVKKAATKKTAAKKTTTKAPAKKTPKKK